MCDSHQTCHEPHPCSLRPGLSGNMALFPSPLRSLSVLNSFTWIGFLGWKDLMHELLMMMARCYAKGAGSSEGDTSKSHICSLIGVCGA